MKTLDQLIRLHRHRLHEKQRNLTRLEAQAADLKLKAETLEAEVLIEEARTEETHFARVSFGAYFERIKQRRNDLAAARSAVDQRVTVARGDLKTEFQELKKIEILRDRKESEALAAESKAEQAALDEVALQQHRRGRG